MATAASTKRQMEPGFYVVRMPENGVGSRLIVESRPFLLTKNGPDREYAMHQAENWRDFIQGQHPKDDVFIIER